MGCALAECACTRCRQTQAGRIFARKQQIPQTSFSFVRTQGHGLMATTVGRNYLVCFYCNKRSGIKNDGLITQWECAKCDSMNYLDEVLSSKGADDMRLIFCNRMAKSPILQLLLSTRHQAASSSPSPELILYHLKAPSPVHSVQHVSKTSTSMRHHLLKCTSRPIRIILITQKPKASITNSRRTSRSDILKSVKTVSRRHSSA